MLVGRPFFVAVRVVTWALCVACSGMSGFGCGAEEAKPNLPAVLATIELPIAHRTANAAPSEATQVELGTSELRIEGGRELKLTNGRVPAGEIRDHVLANFKAKLGAKRVVAISAHAAVPYATLALVIHTALTSGAKELAFKVRKPGSNTDTGWLFVRDNRFARSAEQAVFAAAELPTWDSFARVWEDAVDACQQISQRGDCGYKPVLKAAGGQLDLMLRARGTGLALRFRQTGAPEPATQPKTARQAAEMLDGVKAPPQAREAPPEPSTEHVFTLRADQATVTPSPISSVMKLACGSQTCPAVVDAESGSMSGRVIALIGAAFPDGSADPKLAWVLPSQ